MARNPITASSEKGLRICELYALHGYTKADAYRIGGNLQFPRDKAEREKMMVRSKQNATDFFSRPQVIERVHKLLEGARAEDVARGARTIRTLLDAIESAKESENWTAMAQMLDKLLKVQGLMRERIVFSPEERLNDEQLIDQLSEGDPAKAEMMRRIIGRDSFDKESLD